MSVQDTGCGIPEDIIEKVFEPFFTTKEKGKGTGLGMSTVHGIVKQNGGGIKLNSSPDTGTECIVYWPMVSQDNIDDTEGMKTTELFDSDIKVLIVEDDIKLQKIATRMLGNLVSYVECVDSAEKALVVFGNGSFDILFTDVILTGMSGVELAEKLRKTREDLTIIFTSGYTDELLNQTGLDKGEIFFLQKPYSSKDLQKIFNRAYRESRF